MGPKSTVRLLEPGASSTTTELLGLTASGISDEKGPVVPDENILDLLLALLVHILLVESNKGFGYALPNGVDLRGVTTSLDANTHVHSRETVSSQEEDWLVGLESEDLRLHQLDWATVDLDQTTAALAVGHCHRRLLAPEALYRLDWRISCHG